MSWDEALHSLDSETFVQQPTPAKECLMSRLPDQFGDLLRLEAASGHATAEAGGATTTGSRMAMARLGRLYRYALRHPAAGRDRGASAGGPPDAATRRLARAGPPNARGPAFRELGPSGAPRGIRGARRTSIPARARTPHELVATWRFTFPVVDLVLRDLHRRMRDHTLVIEDGSRRYVHDGCGIRLESRGPRSLPGPARRVGKRSAAALRVGLGVGASVARPRGYLRCGRRFAGQGATIAGVRPCGLCGLRHGGQG